MFGSHSSGSKNKSSGLRILWLPGRRKQHPKGRYDATSKHVNYNSSGQRHANNVWSLGGNKTHKNLLEVHDSETALLDGPSVSGLTNLTTTVGSTAAVAAIAQKAEEQALTPNSEASTALIVSTPNSPDFNCDNTTIPVEVTVENNKDISNMPAATAHSKHNTAQAVIVRTTTTAEILEENRFSILDKPNITENFENFDLPMPPHRNIEAGNELEMQLLNTSNGTNASTSTTPTPSASPKKGNLSSNSSTTSSNKRRKPAQHSNQGDVNSIESISENAYSTLAVGSKAALELDVDWIDDLIGDDPAAKTAALQKQKQQQELLKKGNKNKQSLKERDQLDGVNLRKTKDDLKAATLRKEELQEDVEDEKLVKCLYYTLMCCDCTIS